MNKKGPAQYRPKKKYNPMKKTAKKYLKKGVKIK